MNNSRYFKKIFKHGEIRIINWMGSDDSIADSARVSYSKGTNKIRNNEQLIRYLLRNKHTSPFEMVQIQFYIKAPIFVMRQWMRHRTWSYNEVSGRYSEMVEQAYVPENCITSQEQNNKQYRTNNATDIVPCMSESIKKEQEKLFSNYRGYLKNGLARELARINLPLALYTEVIASVNLHNLLHFLSLRLTEHAQYEIYVYAQAIEEILQELFPVSMHAWHECVYKNVILTEQMSNYLKEIVLSLKNNVRTNHKCMIKKKLTEFKWFSKSEQVYFEKFLEKLSIM